MNGEALIVTSFSPDLGRGGDVDLAERLVEPPLVLRRGRPAVPLQVIVYRSGRSMTIAQRLGHRALDREAIGRLEAAVGRELLGDQLVLNCTALSHGLRSMPFFWKANWLAW